MSIMSVASLSVESTDPVMTKLLLQACILGQNMGIKIIMKMFENQPIPNLIKKSPQNKCLT